MDTPSYISTNIDQLFEEAPEEIQDIIANGDVKEATINISNNYNIPVGKQVALSNVITFILIGALLPENVIKALVELISVTEDDAKKIANDLEHSILEKARMSLFKKDGEVKTLEYQGQKSKEELRKELFDKTKRESGLQKNQSSPNKDKKTKILAPGSRSQLIEQLQVISSIPNDEEIEERLKHIQEQISSLKKEEEDNSLQSNIALKSFMFGEKGKTIADPKLSQATYSIPPEKYNVDPYREIAEE